MLDIINYYIIHRTHWTVGFHSGSFDCIKLSNAQLHGVYNEERLKVSQLRYCESVLLEHVRDKTSWCT